jgi:hypothetical protein
VTDPLASSDPGSQRRRSTRIVQAVPVTVTGVDALGQPFKERTTTTMVNCHGCKYQSKHYVPKSSRVTLDIPRPEPTLPARRVLGRVVWVQRPRTVRELFQIGLEFEVAGNVWGIAFPPDDWFPLPDEQPPAATGSETAVEKKPSTPAPGTAAAISEQLREKVAEVLGEKRPEMPTAVTPSAPAQTPAAKVTLPPPAPTPTATVDQTKIHAVPTPPAFEESQAALARHMSKLVTDAKSALDKSLRHEAEAAINDEMTIVRQQLDVQLHDAVEKAIKLSMERVSESTVKKVVQDAADRTAAIVEEARKADEANVEQLDAKIRQAVEQAVSGAAEQAARQAAQQTAALSLKEAVDKAVEKAITEREASSPSLQILSSPEAAQKQMENWKNTLEEAAQAVRQQALEKSEADATGAAQRWQAEVENALKGASQKLSDQLARGSQAALNRAEQDAADREARWRASIDEKVANAQSTVSSLGVDLAKETARAEAAASQLEEAAKSAQDQSRRALDDFENALEGTSRKAGEQVGEISRAALDRAEKDVTAREARWRASLDETVAKAESTVSSLESNLVQERARAEMAASRLQDAAKTAVEHTRRELDEVLARQLREVTGKTDQVIAERVRQIDPLVEQSARRTADRLSKDLDQKVSAKLEEASRAVTDLADARQQAEQSRESIRSEMQHASDQASRLHDTIREEILQASEQAFQLQGKVREQVAQASETAIQDALARVKEETAKYPAEFEQSCRDVLAKVEADFEQKSTATEHATYEALLRASEWYQKKAHTTMQSSLEKVVEQSTAALRDRAAEISSLVASELDHYRRTYLEHSQAQIEETAKELVERERGKLTETAEVANAAFTDRVRRVTEESLRSFEHSSRDTVEKARSDMKFSREGALAEFQKRVDERILRGIEQAKEQLQSQLLPLMEEMEANRQTQAREWMEHLQRSTDESIEQYKARLENASNSWLLASATTLGQHSQAVLDTLAKAAEKRLKDTCRDVLAGMGETLKERMLGLSGGFASDEDDEPPKR